MARTRTSPGLPLAFAALALVAAACSLGSVPTSDLRTAPPVADTSAAPSAAPDASQAPGSSVAAAPSSSASVARATLEPVTPRPTVKPTPRPTPRPTPSPTAAPAGYQCAALATNSEVRKATGLSDATLLHNRNGTPQEAGQTYCPYLAQGGSVTVALVVWTNASMSGFNKLWNKVLGYSTQVPGIGSQAIIDAGDGTGLAMVGKHGVSVQISGPGGVPGGVDAFTACQALLKLLAARS